MSSFTNPVNTNNQATILRNTSQVLLGGNTFTSADFTNGTGAAITIPEGTVMGRIAATEKIVALTSAATNGSQYPLGIIPVDVTIAAGATKSLSIAVSGEVNENKIVLQAGDTLATDVDGRSIRDRLASDTLGLKLFPTTELSAYDNV